MLYRQVFGCYPDDEMKKINQTKRRKNVDKDMYTQLANEIEGFAVNFPLKFLEGENFKKLKHFEFGLFILPDHIFT